MWTTLDFSGIMCALTDSLLRAAAARARGELRALTLCEDDELSHHALFEVARANADTLTELRGVEHDDEGEWQLAALLRAAPRLRVLQADVTMHSARVLAMLSNQAPYEVLRLRHLTLGESIAWQWYPPPDVHELAAALRGHTSLQRICLEYPTTELLAAVNDALDEMLANNLVGCELTFRSEPLRPVVLSLFLRLLECGSVTHLGLAGLNFLLARTRDAHITPLLDALRANTTLTSLSITSYHRRGYGEGRLEGCTFAPAALLQALTSHAGLRRLALSNIVALDSNHAAALGALVAANAPALRELSLVNCGLDLNTAIVALPQNTHLRALQYAPLPGHGVSDNDVRNLLVPALLANTGLRELQLEADDASMSRTIRAAVAIVMERGRAGGAAAE